VVPISTASSGDLVKVPSSLTGSLLQRCGPGWSMPGRPSGQESMESEYRRQG
jgi:hypothetical protein